LPAGTVALHGNPFDVRGLIQLAAHREIGSVYPDEATGIPVGRQCKRIHFLHGASEVRAAAGTQVAAYVFHYADGTRAELPVVFGRDVADWWGNSNGLVTASEASEAWTGTNPAIAGMPPGGYIRLFLSTRDNPFPQKQIATIDFVSARVKAAPFVVAISLE
jgi:hypothetical protein